MINGGLEVAYQLAGVGILYSLYLILQVVQVWQAEVLFVDAFALTVLAAVRTWKVKEC